MIKVSFGKLPYLRYCFWTDLSICQRYFDIKWKNIDQYLKTIGLMMAQASHK